LFFAAKNQFTSLFDNIDGKAERKASIAKQVEDYGDVFSQWIASFNQIDPLRKMINLDAQDMLPRTDHIIAHARKTMETAAEQLEASQMHTRTSIVALGFLIARRRCGEFRRGACGFDQARFRTGREID
jgi:hypothetical protein